MICKGAETHEGQAVYSDNDSDYAVGYDFCSGYILSGFGGDSCLS
jgi:hypothetical protein